MSPRRSAALCLLLAAGLVAGAAAPRTAARAEDAWNPFKEREDRARGRRPATPAAAEPSVLQSPVLAPMEGVGAKPWRTDGSPPPGTGPAASDPGPGPELGPGPGTAGRPGWQAAPDPAQTAVERIPLAPLEERARAVERNDLSQPVMSSDGAGLPFDLWQGLDVRAVEALVAELHVPPRSSALNGLWRRLWAATATPPGGQGPAHFEAVRIEALYRSGLVGDLAARLASQQPATADPLLAAQRARVAIATGRREAGCAEARQIGRTGTSLPKPIKSELLLLGAYCAGLEGNAEAAALAVELARAEAVEAPLALAALDAFAAGQPFAPKLPERITLMDYRYLELAKAQSPGAVLARAEPALLGVLASDEHLPAGQRIAAAEAAAFNHVLDSEHLATLYRDIAGRLPAAADPLASRGDATTRRAELFRAIESERTPMRRTRLARALLDEGRRSGLYLPMAALLAGPIGEIHPAQEIGWFAETAIEIHLAAGNPAAARVWSEFAAREGEDRQHWELLIDLADARHQGKRGAGFAAVERLAVRGRLPADLLHRLATVLDALDYQIPIPLWEAASRTPQPATGHLPETGVLSQLQDAAQKKEFARAVLLAMRAIGNNSADGAHIIALGDTVRALKRSGLEADARRLALEAILPAWPRAVGG